MAIQMASPGVYVTEIDRSEIVPSTSASVTVFGGDFTKGPVGIHTQITSVDDLIEFYGKPTNENYNQWYQCYNFLQYGNNLLVSRAANLNGAPTYMKTEFQGTSDNFGYGTVEYGTSEYGDGEDAQMVFVTQGSNIEVGDIIGFSDNVVNSIDESKTVRYYVIGITETAIENEEGASVTYTGLMLHKNLELPPSANPEIETVDSWYAKHSKCYKINVHHNGSCEALEKGNAVDADVTWKFDTKTFKEDGEIKKYITPYKVPVSVPNWLDGSPKVVQSTEHVNDGIANVDVYSLDYLKPKKINGALLFETNTKILNPNDWDYKYSAGSIAFANAKSKLKFISRTPGIDDSLYEITIAVPSDFAYNDKEHVGNHCIRYAQPGIPVDGFFEYAPAEGSAQIAVFIYDTVNKEMKETYLCSLDPDEMDSYNNSMFIEKVINRQSNCVYVKCNTATPATKEIEVKTFDEQGNTTGVKKVVTPNIESYCFVADHNGKFVGHSLSFSCASDSTIQDDDLLNAYEIFNNKDEIDIDIIIANEIDNGVSAKNLAEKREDCIAFMGIPYSYNGNILTVSRKTAEATANIVNYRNSINYNSMWCSLVANYKYQYDRYNDIYRWVNVAGDVAGLRAQSTENYAAWWASAGLNRGQIKNVTKLAYSPNRTQIGTLYNAGINAVVTFPGQGTVLWGQKTMLDKASSFDRVNVRGLFNCIERALAKMSKHQIFEFNDVFTRNKIISIINPYLETVKSDRGIQDFMVVCDTTNNTPDIISRNQLIVDIYIKPTYVAEFINLRFINAGVNDFSTIIQNS